VVFKFALLTLVALLSLTVFTEASISQQKTPEEYDQQGLQLMAAEEFEQAAKIFEEAIKLKPDYAEAHYHLGNAYFEAGEAKKAIDAYKKAIRYKPDFALAYDGLGAAYGASEYKKSIEAYKESIRLDPKPPLTHYNLGVAYVRHDDNQSAVAEYNVLQTLDPALGQDLYNLIYKPIMPVAVNGTVRLRVIVLDSQGAPISGLTSHDFGVTEDGVAQNISVISQPDSSLYCLSIDTSGSIRPVLEMVIGTSKDIVEMLSATDQTAIVNFVDSEKIQTLQEFTASKRRLGDAIDALYVEGGQSAVLDAVYLSAQRLASYKFPNRNVRRVLFLLTDGEDRASYYSSEQVLALLRSLDIQILAISFNNNNDRKLNQHLQQKPIALLKNITSATGGAAFFPKSNAELKASVNAMFDFVRRGYTIEYKPTKPIEAGSYRSVSITMAPSSQHSNSMIIARPGYSVPPTTK